MSFMRDREDKDKPYCDIAFGVQMLIMQMWTDKYPTVFPNDLVDSIISAAQTINTELDEPNQHDIHEFFTLVMNSFEYAYDQHKHTRPPDYNKDFKYVRNKEHGEREHRMSKQVAESKRLCDSYPFNLFRFYNERMISCVNDHVCNYTISLLANIIITIQLLFYCY